MTESASQKAAPALDGNPEVAVIAKAHRDNLRSLSRMPMRSDYVDDLEALQAVRLAAEYGVDFTAFALPPQEDGGMEFRFLMADKRGDLLEYGRWCHYRMAVGFLANPEGVPVPAYTPMGFLTLVGSLKRRCIAELQSFLQVHQGRV